MCKKISQIMFLFAFTILGQRSLAASYLERTYEDIIHCRHLIEKAYDNGLYNLSSGIADKYIELKHFCRFESVKEAKENPLAFRTKKGIDGEEFLLKLGHIYKGASEERTVIVFRGSQCRDEWVGELGNLKGTVAAAETLHSRVPGMIHEGFLRAVGQFYPAIQECMDINTIRKPNHEILVTGHSRGAAFALLVAVRLQSWLQEQDIDTKNRIKIITFSAPEMVIGDSRFWKHVDTEIGGMNVIKIYNDLDLVPKISLGNLANYASPQNVFAIKIPIWKEDIIPAYTEKMMGVLLRYQQQPNARLVTLVREAIQESVIFPHGIQGDSMLEKGYKEQLPEYIGRWIQEFYFPQVLSFIPEVSLLCAEHLITCQKDHNNSGGEQQLIAEKMTSFLRGSEEILQNSQTLEEKRMRFVHFMIRCGIDAMAVSPLLKDVEMEWRKSIGLGQEFQEERASLVDSEKRKLVILPPSNLSSGFLNGKENFDGSAGSEMDDIEKAKKQSLKDAEGIGHIGPRLISGWELEDVEDNGNCFYLAMADQMRRINYIFLNNENQNPALLYDVMRRAVQGGDYLDKEWADQEDIKSFIKKFDVVLAVVDTRRPERGFVYSWFDGEDIITRAPDAIIPLPEGKPLIKIAATGNHFLSVKKHPE